MPSLKFYHVCTYFIESRFPNTAENRPAVFSVTAQKSSDRKQELFMVASQKVDLGTEWGVKPAVHTPKEYCKMAFCPHRKQVNKHLNTIQD